MTAVKRGVSAQHHLQFIQRYRLSPLARGYVARTASTPARDRNLGDASKCLNLSNWGIFTPQTRASAKSLSTDGLIVSLNHRCHNFNVGNPTNVAVREKPCLIVEGLTTLYSASWHLSLLEAYYLRGRMHILQASYPGFGDAGCGVSLVKPC